MVWGISPGDAGQRPGRAHLRDAPRRQGRPAGRRQRHGAAALLAAFEAAGGVLRASTSGRPRSRARASGCAASRSSTAPRSPHPIVVSACNPHDTFLHWLKHPPPPARRSRAAWQDAPPRRRLRVEDRRRHDRVPRSCVAVERPARSDRRSIAPSSRRHPSRAATSWHEWARSWNGPGCSSTSRRVIDPTMAPGRTATCSASRRCTRRTGCRAAGRIRPSRGAGSSCSPTSANPGSSTRSSSGGR